MKNQLLKVIFVFISANSVAEHGAYSSTDFASVGDSFILTV